MRPHAQDNRWESFSKFEAEYRFDMRIFDAPKLCVKDSAIDHYLALANDGRRATDVCLQRVRNEFKAQILQSGIRNDQK